MTPVESLLDVIRSVSKSEKEKGDRFEELMLHAFRTDRTFAQQFTEIWLWKDWPNRTTVDIGVDLVATAPDGGLIAIQCKCYDPSTTLDKAEIDSFISESSKAHWARRIIVSTTDKWSKHAEEALQGHQVPIERLGVDHLDAMTVEWSSYDIDNPRGLKATDKHVLLPHQTAALRCPARCRPGTTTCSPTAAAPHPDRFPLLPERSRHGRTRHRRVRRRRPDHRRPVVILLRARHARVAEVHAGVQEVDINVKRPDAPRPANTSYWHKPGRWKARAWRREP